jgi:hypothetical protein
MQAATSSSTAIESTSVKRDVFFGNCEHIVAFYHSRHIESTFLTWSANLLDSIAGFDFDDPEIFDFSTVDWPKDWPSPRTVDDPQRDQFKAASNASGLT